MQKETLLVRIGIIFINITQLLNLTMIIQLKNSFILIELVN